MFQKISQQAIKQNDKKFSLPSQKIGSISGIDFSGSEIRIAHSTNKIGNGRARKLLLKSLNS